MAFPIIKVDSTNGAASDTACSGAGPSTALTGTAAASDGAGTTITLDAGTVLTGVDTTGRHVLLFRDTTAGHRQFSRITGTAGSGGATPTVTLADAVTISLSGKSWAIGGVRATVGGSISALLLANNGAAGDAMPGWIVEMQSGHSETYSAGLEMRRAGDQTSGLVTLRGAIGAATLPLLTITTDNNAVSQFAGFQECSNFELRCSAGTHTNGYGILLNEQSRILGLKISHSTQKFWRGVRCKDNPAGRYAMMACEIGYCADIGVLVQGASRGSVIAGNYIHDVGAVGIDMNNVDAITTLSVLWNVVANSASHGVRLYTSTSDQNRGFAFIGNTITNNTGSGLYIDGFLGNSLLLSSILNNIFASNGAYGVNFANASHTAAYLAGSLVALWNNDFYSNTSGKYNPSGLDTAGVSRNEQTLDPQFTNAGAGDYTIGTNLKALGWPSLIGAYN